METLSRICPQCGCDMGLEDNRDWPSGLGEWLFHKDRQWVWHCPYCCHEMAGDSSPEEQSTSADMERAMDRLKTTAWLEASRSFDRVVQRQPRNASAWIGKGLAATALCASARNQRVAKEHAEVAKACLEKPWNLTWKWIVSPSLSICDRPVFPCQLASYENIISSLSVAKPAAEVEKLVDVLLDLCKKDWIITHNQFFNDQLLALDEFYYSLARHLDAELELQPAKSRRVNMPLVYLARRAGLAGQREKVLLYNQIRTSPVLQVRQHLLSHVMNRNYWQEIEVVEVDAPDESTAVVRAVVREPLDGIKLGWSSEDFKYIPVDYAREYRFHRRCQESISELLGAWYCEEELSEPEIPIESLDEWAEPATEFDEHKSELFWLTRLAQDRRSNPLSDEQSQILSVRIQELGVRGVLTPLEAAMALSHYGERDAAVAFLQEQLDLGILEWRSVRDQFKDYRWRLKKPKKRRWP